MSRRPRGKKYEGLVRRKDGASIYLRKRMPDGRRLVRSLKTDDWDKAVEIRDAYLAAKGLDTPQPAYAPKAPTFGELAEEWLESGAYRRLSHTTREERDRHLTAGESSPTPFDYFRDMPVHTIRPATLWAWWDEQIAGAGLSEGTGRNHLNSIRVVLNHAQRREWIETNPAAVFAAQLGEGSRTKSARAAKELDPDKVVVLPSPARAATLVAVSDALARTPARRRMHLGLVLMLDCGLRIGEVGALRWECVGWKGPRTLLVDRNRVNAAVVENTKSGKTRHVDMTKRVFRLLRERWMAEGQPSEGWVLPGFAKPNFARRHMSEVASKAGTPGLTAHGLRHSFATLLRSSGFPLEYVSRMLGHADVGFTQRVYARFVPSGATLYAKPPELDDGQVPGDILAAASPVRGWKKKAAIK